VTNAQKLEEPAALIFDKLIDRVIWEDSEEEYFGIRFARVEAGVQCRGTGIFTSTIHNQRTMSFDCLILEKRRHKNPSRPCAVSDVTRNSTLADVLREYVTGFMRPQINLFRTRLGAVEESNTKSSFGERMLIFSSDHEYTKQEAFDPIEYFQSPDSLLRSLALFVYAKETIAGLVRENQTKEQLYQDTRFFKIYDFLGEKKEAAMDLTSKLLKTPKDLQEIFNTIVGFYL
jgi:hypothetical protein